MEKIIEVHDDILNPRLVNDIESFIKLSPQEFKYYFLKNTTNPEFSHFQPGLLHSLFSPNQIPSPFSTYFNQVLYNFCSNQDIKLREIYNSRVFLQFPLPCGISKEETPHIDVGFPHMVCLYYINDSDGDTILYEDDLVTEIQRVTPKKGRIVFFDGSIKHCGSFPTKTYRSIINFNFLGEKF